MLDDTKRLRLRPIFLPGDRGQIFHLKANARRSRLWPICYEAETEAEARILAGSEAFTSLRVHVYLQRNNVVENGKFWHFEDHGLLACPS